MPMRSAISRSCGHVVGSHSHTHPDIYRELHWNRWWSSGGAAVTCWRSLLGEPCVTAAVPGGEISSAVLRSAASAGLRYLFTSEPWLKPRIVGGCWVLGRFCPKASTSSEEIAELADFRGWTSKLLVRRLKGMASRSVPPLYRLYVSRGPSVAGVESMIARATTAPRIRESSPLPSFRPGTTSFVDLPIIG